MLRKYLGVLAILAALFIGATGTITPAMAQTNGEVPGTALGIKSDTDLWRFVRTGNAGSTQMKGELSADNSPFICVDPAFPVRTKRHKSVSDLMPSAVPGTSPFVCAIAGVIVPVAPINNAARMAKTPKYLRNIVPGLPSFKSRI